MQACMEAGWQKKLPDVFLETNFPETRLFLSPLNPVAEMFVETDATVPGNLFWKSLWLPKGSVFPVGGRDAVLREGGVHRLPQLL